MTPSPFSAVLKAKKMSIQPREIDIFASYVLPDRKEVVIPTVAQRSGGICFSPGVPVPGWW
jgi:hypothetical protein